MIYIPCYYIRKKKTFCYKKWMVNNMKIKKKLKRVNKPVYIKSKIRCDKCMHKDVSCFVNLSDKTVRTKFFNFGQAEDIKDGEHCRFYSRKVMGNE